MEKIGDELLVRMKADKRNPLAPAVRDFDFSSVEAMLIANEAVPAGFQMENLNQW
ncbi:MAG: hypothetical protein Q8R96_03530 [Bacteroidota bacterium]|nr:hypothetical protein [Bacteroidota bacterium]